MNNLSYLPSPPAGKSGWPWTEESVSILPFGNKIYPKISIVTPSLNHGEFIEETIRSVLLQNYPDLEYIIIDGGSRDNTLEIIKKYEKWITFWVSEPDKSQSDAINKGFRRCSGEMVNWICSDDMLCRNALNSVAAIFDGKTDTMFIGRGLRISRYGDLIDHIPESKIETFDELIDIRGHWRRGNSIMQQSCLYPLKAVKDAGYLNVGNHYTMDYELWGEFLLNNLNFTPCNVEIGMFRWYGGQKTSESSRVTFQLLRTAFLLIRKNKNISFISALSLTFKLIIYGACYYYHSLRSFIGIKRRIKSLVYG